MTELSIFRIDKMWRGERGKQTGLYVHLYNVTSDYPYEHPHFCTEYHQSEVIAVLEEAGVGAEVKIQWKQNGKFWNINKVYKTKDPAEESAPPKESSPPRESAPVSTAPEEKEPVQDKNPGQQPIGKKRSNSPRSAAELIRTDALAQSVDLTTVMLNGPDKLKKQLASVEAIVQLTLQNALTFDSFIRGETVGEISSDDTDLNPAGVDADDGIPF